MPPSPASRAVALALTTLMQHRAARTARFLVYLFNLFFMLPFFLALKDQAEPIPQWLPTTCAISIGLAVLFAAHSALPGLAALWVLKGRHEGDPIVEILRPHGLDEPYRGDGETTALWADIMGPEYLPLGAAIYHALSAQHLPPDRTPQGQHMRASITSRTTSYRVPACPPRVSFLAEAPDHRHIQRLVFTSLAHRHGVLAAFALVHTSILFVMEAKPSAHMLLRARHLLQRPQAHAPITA